MGARHRPANRPGRSPSRLGFAAAVVAISLLLAAATIGVLARGDQVDLTPVAVAPAPADGAVSTRARLHIRFDRPMKPETVELRLRVEPDLPGAFQWNGPTLIFTPSRPFLAATEYRVTLDAGLEESRGRRSRRPFAWTFTTRAPAVVALRHADGAANLWLLDPAGGPGRPLTRERVAITDFSLAPDGERAAYTRQDGPTRTSVWVVNLQTGATSRLSPDEPASFAAPAWSPEDDLIVFERRQETPGAIANPKLMAVRADGTSAGLIYGRGDEVGFGARWSPDGGRLAFFDPVRQAIVIFNFTRDRVQIPVQTTVAYAWSPDGRRLVVEDILADGGAFQHVLLLADAASGATTRLTTEAGVDDAAPAWSPDGRQIAFTRRPIAGAIGGAQPMARAADGGPPRPLLPAAEPTVETTQIDWSPDGQRLLLGRLPLNNPSADTELWLAEPSGVAGPRHLGAGSAAAWLP